MQHEYTTTRRCPHDQNIVDYGQQLQMAFSLHVVESVSEYYNF